MLIAVGVLLAGLILSKGGPFIHLCALVAHFLCQLPLFTLINQARCMPPIYAHTIFIISYA